MKTIRIILLVTTISVITACGEKKTSMAETQSGMKSLKAYDTKGIDTINRIDVAGNKQGEWRVYKENVLIEKGMYKDGKKHGVWIYFDSNGTVKDEIKYENDKPISN